MQAGESYLQNSVQMQCLSPQKMQADESFMQNSVQMNSLLKLKMLLE
jgi:hypothetical protein